MMEMKYWKIKNRFIYNNWVHFFISKLSSHHLKPLAPFWLWATVGELFSFSNISVTSPTSQLILHPFRHFTYITAHSPTLPLLYLHHSSFSNPSIASPTPQFILQPFFCFSCVTGSSLTSPGEPPMEIWIRAHSPNLSVTSPTSQLIL